MSTFFDFFKPAEHKQEIQDQKEIKRQYRYWRIRIFYAMYIGYVFYYFSRKSFTFAMPMMMTDLGLDKSQLGILASVLSITYGLSKFVSGIFSDRSNPRFFMAIGLILTGIVNIFFGLSSSILFFAVFWGLNGWFQGFGWPPCSRLLTHWYSKSERGTWWSLWSTSHNLGGALIPILATFCAQYYGWRYAMFVPGVICIIAGLFLMNRLRDTPQSLGLPSIEKHRDDYPHDIKHGSQERELTFKERLFDYVLKNPFIWILAFASLFIYIIRTAMNDWTALFLMESKGYSIMAAGSCVFWFEIGGFIGMLFAGWLSDRLFDGRRGPVNLIFSLGILGSVLLFWLYPGHVLLIDSLLVFTTGFFVFGPQMLIGLAAAELSHKKASGTATGFAGWFAYIGAAVAGYPLGYIAQSWGWVGYFLAISVCCLVSCILFAPLWNSDSNKKSLSSELLADLEVEENSSVDANSNT